jgi:amphi-Trp domain-containing protein
MNRVTTAHPPVGVNTATRPRDSAAEKPKDSRMSDFRCKEKERLSRQEVAEWLTDIAYALTAGGRLKLDGDAEVRMPIAGPVVLKRKSRSKDGRVELGIELSWSEPT